MPLEITNGIGKVGVRNPAAVSIDSDAQAFITAAALTDTTQKNAIDELVKDLKAANIWTKMKAIYPMVGGTATTHKFNLKDPRDLNAAFRLQFNGGWTHTSNGAQGNGTNNYADTFFNMAYNLTFEDSGFSIYFKNNGYGSHGIRTSSLTNNSSMWYNGTDWTQFFWGLETSSNRVATGIAQTIGFWSLNRKNSTQFSVYRNSGLFGSANGGGGFASLNFYLSAMNDNGTVTTRSNSLLSFSALHTGLTDLESLLFYQIVEKFQYTLGRNVNANQSFYYDRNYTNETNAFIVNGGITDTTQRTAVNTLVSTLKTAGIWTKMKAVYPMVGGTATSHKFNLVNPVDTNAAFRLTFVGGWTHDSNGALPNGTTGYANTNLNPYVSLQPTSNHMSYYSRTQVSAVQYEMGVLAVNQYSLTLYESTTAKKSFIFGSYPTNMASVNDSNTKGFQIGSKTSATSLKLYWNNSNVVTNTQPYSANLPNANVFIAAINYSSLVYSSKQCAFASIGDGLTDAEATTFYNAVQAFQTTLGRQV